MRIFVTYTTSFLIVAVIGLTGTSPATASITPAPVFSLIAPSVGPTSGGTAFTITGSAFTGVTAVTFGGADATSVSVVSDTEITGVTPAGSVGSSAIDILSPNGNTQISGAFFYSTVNLSATTVVAGSTLTVSGVTSPGAAVSVSFDNVGGSTTADATTGAYSVQMTPVKAIAAGYTGAKGSFVIVKAGASVISTSADTVTVTQDLTAASQLMDGTGSTGTLDASLAPGTQYDVISLIGSPSLYNSNSLDNSDFVGTVGASTPTLASLTGPYATFTSQTGVVQYAAVWVNAGAIGAKWVLYSVTSGTTIGSPQTAEINGTYTLTPFNDPAITGTASVTFNSSTPNSAGLAPATGPDIGGTSFTLTVVGGITATGVTIGGNPATSFTTTVYSAGSPSTTVITGVTPVGTAGPADVVITESSGSLTLTGAYTYTATGLSITGITLNMSGSGPATYQATNTGSGWTVSVPQDTALTLAAAHYTLSSVTVAMSGANIADSFVVTLDSGPGVTSPMRYGTLSFANNAWTLSPGSEQSFETTGTWILTTSVVADGTGGTSPLKLTLVVTPTPRVAVSGITLTMNNATTYAATGSGTTWAVTVPQDTASTILTAHYALSSVNVAMTGANTADTFPATFVSGPGVSNGNPYGTLKYVNNAWTLTPVSPQTFETAGTWVLRAQVADIWGTLTTVQLTLNVTRLAPTVSTGAVTGVTSAGGILQGSVTNPGVDSVGAPQFCYSTSPFSTGGCSGSNGTVVSASGSSPYSTTLNGLAPSATYYVEFEATDTTTNTSLFGGVQQFTTLASAISGGGGGGGSLMSQAPLTLTSTSGVAGTPLPLTSTGGSGTGAVTYAVTNVGTAGCSIAGGSISVTSAGTCTVTVSKAGDTTYLPTSSSLTTVTFALGTQAPLTLTSTSGTVGQALVLSTSGGSGTGAVSFVVTVPGTAGCIVTGSALHATATGSCTVVASKAGDAMYGPTSSPSTVMTFTAKKAPPKKVAVGLRAIRVNGFVWVGRTVTVTIVGTGFYGQPTITSNEAGTTAIVAHDNGRVLVVRVTLLAGSATGWHTFTITLANGKSCKVNYLVK